MGGSVRYTLSMLFASVLVSLLIVCLNLANLMFARVHGRVHEFSVRTALGAGQIRLMQQILTESLFISSLGTPWVSFFRQLYSVGEGERCL